MPGAKHHRWEIIEAHEFRQQLKELFGNAGKQVDQYFLDGVKNQLSRDPYWGHEIFPGSKTRLIKTHRETAAWLMPIVIQYTIADESKRTVELLRIRVDKRPNE